MTDLASNNYIFIAGIIFLAIAVLGQTKLAFIEINPGCFGRTLALLIGVVSLLVATGMLTFPIETLNLNSIKDFFTQQLKQYAGLINDFIQGS